MATHVTSVIHYFNSFPPGNDVCPHPSTIISGRGVEGQNPADAGQELEDACGCLLVLDGSSGKLLGLSSTSAAEQYLVRYQSARASIPHGTVLTDRWSIQKLSCWVRK